jgi:hypothetical protein
LKNEIIIEKNKMWLMVDGKLELNAVDLEGIDAKAHFRAMSLLRDHPIIMEER